MAPRTTAFDRFDSGTPYERYVGRWSRQVAPGFLAWIDVRPGRHWLDVGCGTGALCSAIIDRAAPASLVGVDPSAGFLAQAEAQLRGSATLHQGDAAHLPLADGAVDVAVSGLVLNFLPDPDGAVREMCRVTRPGGTIAAYVWDYAGRMELMRYFWAAAAELDAAAAVLDQGERFPICRPDGLRDCFAAAGLEDLDVTAIEIATPFGSFDEYWEPFLGGQGSAPGYAMSLDEPARERLRERLRERVPARPDGSIALRARAWAVRGSRRRAGG